MAGRVALTGLAPPFRGGIAHYTLHLGEALTRTSHVRLFAWSRQYPRLVFPGTTQHDPSPMGLTVQTVRVLDPLRPWSWLEAARLMREFGAGRVVHQWWHPWFAPATWVLLRTLRTIGLRITVLCHNLEPHESLPAARAAARTALMPADRIVVHGEHDARVARMWWPRTRVVVHPHPPYHALAGPDVSRREARQRLGLPPGAPIVLFFGCVRPYKGLADLIEAMPRVRERFPDALLATAGEFYDPRHAYEERARGLGLEDGVRFDDRYVPNDEVGLWLRAADLVALPYRDATGSGVLPLARAAGVPVVSTRVGDLPDLMQDGRDGRLVPARDHRALAAAITGVLESPPDGRAIARAAREHGWAGLARATCGADPG